MEEKVSNHPCHRLSIPSAKLFWCRHCMQSFEDPINRWRHSKTCKTGGPSNHDKRLEQEPFALQTYVETREKEVANQPQLVENSTGEQVMIIRPEHIEQKSEYSCFICKRPFDSLDDMKEHVKYPCSKNQNTDYPIYIPGSGGTYVENLETFPNSTRRNTILPDPSKKNIIQREVVQGEIVEQSADPETGVRTFEVHSQNDDVPLSEILSRLSESGYLVAGEMESPVSQVIVVQQVDEKGQITQSEHILPPHIQIQNTENTKSSVEEIETTETTTEVEESQGEEVTYYVTESGELIDPEYVQVKQEPRQDLYYGSYDSQSGMNILTQAAEATIGNLIKQEKRKNEEEEGEEEEDKLKRSRTQCKPEEETPHQRPHSPRSPRGPGSGGNTGTESTSTVTNTTVKTESNGSENSNQGNGDGKQQSTEQVNDENTPNKSTREKKSKSKKEKKTGNKKSCARSSSPDQFKCRICDKTFKTNQLLLRHSQYPCKVFNTRNMCQKILRPKRAIGKDATVKHTKPVSSNCKRKPTSNVFRKPILLLDGLRILPNLLNEKRIKPKAIKKKVVYIPTPPRIKTIWLPDKAPLVVEDLPLKEQFFYEFGLFSVRHIDQNDSLIAESMTDPECKALFAPLMISTSMHCSKNSEIVDDFLPPVLERMDSTVCLDDDDLLDEPPILSPVLNVQDKISTAFMSSHENSIPEEKQKLPILLAAEGSDSTTAKSPDPKRHFTDLFIEASPNTSLSSLHLNSSSEPNKSLIFKKCSETKPVKEMLLKTDAISKLANELKKKLSPPKNPNLTDTPSMSTLKNVKKAKQNLETLFSQLCPSVENMANSDCDLSTSGAKSVGPITNLEVKCNSGNNVLSIVFNTYSTEKKKDTKTLVLPIVKSNCRSEKKSPTKISVVLFKSKQKCDLNAVSKLSANSDSNPAKSNDAPCNLNSTLVNNLKTLNNVSVPVVKSEKSVGYCPEEDSVNEFAHKKEVLAVGSLQDTHRSEIFEESNYLSKDVQNVDKSYNENENYRQNTAEEDSSKVIEDIKTNTGTCSSIDINSCPLEQITKSKDMDNSMCLPDILSHLLNKNKKTSTPFTVSNTHQAIKPHFTCMSFPKYLYDEGIVDDIFKSKSTGNIWGRDVDQKSESVMEKDLPKVMVQYVEQVDQSQMSDDDDYETSRSSDSSPDFLVHKIALCEEEIVLSDSGLDDSDEMMTQHCLESDTIIQTVQC